MNAHFYIKTLFNFGWMSTAILQGPKLQNRFFTSFHQVKIYACKGEQFGSLRKVRRPDIQTRCPSIIEFEVHVRSHPQKKFSHATIFWKGLQGFVASEIKLEDDCQNTNLRDQSLIYCCPKGTWAWRATTTPQKVQDFVRLLGKRVLHLFC